ncbi:Protein of unknown function (DUF2029) [Leptolyngbyaceae cyanobacterium JSC-12]|nr:Protein of unknown function (DUF2029) [Leptolyngbyaceae cyanobacterium JSC-12]
MKVLTTIPKTLTSPERKFSTWLLYTALIVSAAILPLIIWKLNLSIVARTGTRFPGMLDTQPFELFGFFTTIALSIITYLEIKKSRKKNLAAVAPILLPFFVLLNLLFTLTEFASKSSDYMCYENAARSVANSLNPYNTGSPSCYLYPPLFAQGLAFLYQMVNQLVNKGNLFPSGDGGVKSFYVVFYIYQCIQFTQLILAWFLCYLFSRKIGLKVLYASLFVSALFLFNNPLIRTLKFSQVNLWLLNSFLAAILLLRHYPLLSGFSVALGGHLKLYSFVLMVPWSLTKKWRAVFGAILFFAVILILQTGFGQDWTLWQQFFQYFREVEKPTNYRNNGLYGIVYNFFKIPHNLIGLSFDAVPVVVFLLSLLIIIWFALRFIQREKAYLQQSKNVDSETRDFLDEVFRLYGHSVDAIALSLLISPSVWEHHYVIAIPIALWAIATRSSTQPWLVGLGVFLVFCLPTSDFFPLSYHRVIGLLILVYSVSPQLIQNKIIQNKIRSPNYLSSASDLSST